jgi:very-short-patch-repair endonuclease
VARRVLLAADGRAENHFESVLRAQAIDEGLDVLPQQPVDLAERRVTPDLVDAGRRLVVEADSWTYHAEKSAFSRDMWRYNALVVAGWRVLRFTREMVMDQPDRVRAVLRAARSGGR